MSYYEICEKIRQQNWTYVFNDEQKVPYAYKGTEWVGFDNIKSIRLKTQYMMDNNLGGAMVWSLDTDDFDGKFCDQGKYPLISTIKSIIEGTYNESNESDLKPIATTTPTPATENPLLSTIEITNSTNEPSSSLPPTVTYASISDNEKLLINKPIVAASANGSLYLY